MRIRTSVGLIVIFGVVGLLASVSNEQGSTDSAVPAPRLDKAEPAGPNGARAGRKSKQAAGQQPENMEAPDEKLDYSKPIYTTDYAIVCPQGVLLAAFLDRRQGHGPEQIYDVFTSIWNHSKKVQNLGCEEWRAGIRVFAHRMNPPFDDFVGFSLTRGEMADFFTMEPHLTNHRP